MRIKPTKRQLDFLNWEFGMFFHFGIRSFFPGHNDWDGRPMPASAFNPTRLDCEQWIRIAKTAGANYSILVCKHHDGFANWPSKYSDYSVAQSPWQDGKGDVVRECAEACRRGGIKFGVYLSPWDRNSKYYGTDAYNDYYCNQLTELLTNYGELFMVWFDGACGEGPNGKKQVYDFDRYIALIRKYQPNACIFNDHGPDVRWCGNEAGQARRAEWAVVPTELCYRCDVQTGPGPLAEGADLSFMYNSDQNIGELNNIMYSKGLGFAGSEIDMSIRPGWFYHEKEEPHSLDRLFRTYINSCGANTSFNLNVPPMPSGRFDPRDIQRLKELGELLENSFGESKKVPCTVKKIDTGSDTQCKYEIELPEETDVRFVELREDLAAAGQRIESFRIYGDDGCKYYDYTVGHRRLCWMKTKTKKLILHITSARDEVVLRDISVYKA